MLEREKQKLRAVLTLLSPDQVNKLNLKFIPPPPPYYKRFVLALGSKKGKGHMQYLPWTFFWDFIKFLNHQIFKRQVPYTFLN